MSSSVTNIKHKITTGRGLFKVWVADGVFGQVPRLAFGNSAGFRNNLAPALHAALSPVRRSGSPYAAADLPDVTPIRDDGYMLTDASYDPAALGDLIRHFRQVIEDKEFTRPNGKYSVEIKDPFQSLPELADLLNAHVRDLLHSFYGRSFEVVETQCFRNFTIPESDRELEAYSNFWHCDNYPVDWLKVYVFLSDWAETSGPTEIMPVPATKEVMRSGYVNRYFSLIGEDRMGRHVASAAKATGATGTEFIFNPQRCLHRAGIPADGKPRDAVMFFVAGSSAAADQI